MATATYTKSGTKAATAAKLNKEVFGLSVDNHELIKHAYVAYLSNRRNANATVKTRGLVRGGGRKPWRQKGTGRARFGSSRNPIWRGGGIVFGPTGNENYTKKMSTAAKQQAIRQALSLAASADKIAVIEAFSVTTGKTADAVKLLQKLNADRNVLVVVDHKSAETVRALQNIPYVHLVTASYLNVYDVTNADTIIITKPSLDVIDQWLGGNK